MLFFALKSFILKFISSFILFWFFKQHCYCIEISCFQISLLFLLLLITILFSSIISSSPLLLHQPRNPLINLPSYLALAPITTQSSTLVSFITRCCSRVRLINYNNFIIKFTLLSSPPNDAPDFCWFYNLSAQKMGLCYIGTIKIPYSIFVEIHANVALVLLEHKILCW
jgi:hypothetical protein